MIKIEKIILGTPKTKKGTSKDLLDYVCGWCGTKFKQYVVKSGSQGNGKKGDVADQVQCPKCKNFLKIW